eukprot:5013318-Amphidinium_carterae.1
MVQGVLVRDPSEHKLATTTTAQFGYSFYPTWCFHNMRASAAASFPSRDRNSARGSFNASSEI